VRREDVHGGNIFAAARIHGGAVSRLIDFSACINALGPSKHALHAARGALRLCAHYPDLDCHVLVEKLAAHWNLDSGNFLIGNGSTELIHLLPHALSIRHAIIVGPSFSEYSRAVSLARAQVTHLRAARKNKYWPPVKQILRAIRESRRNGMDALFLCNPNSPTGQVIQANEVLEIVEAAADRGIWTVVDEAFIEYCQNQSVLAAAPRKERLIVLRSFTKFYALPGLRIGYLVGSLEAVGRVRRHQPPWSVNTVAQAAACAALEDGRHAERSLEFMQNERKYLSQSLSGVPGLSVFASETNFLLIELPSSLPATRVTQILCRQRLLVRDCSSMAGLNKCTIRIAIRTRPQNQQLVAALRRILKA
jgi:threonine-phosphate decarboxylase